MRQVDWLVQIDKWNWQKKLYSWCHGQIFNNKGDGKINNSNSQWNIEGSAR